MSPTQLLDTGRRALLAVVISGYSDKREIEAALPSPGILDEWGDRPELWVDYVADLGDGFNPTFAVATLLARPTLTIPGRTNHETKQGSILVMGGDQVYPAASLRRYQNKLIGPYRAALPYREVDPPALVAVPGNHDWFDGLTSFVRVFCQGEWVGGWKTRQRRSYFAIKLPHHWWLWAIDIQFDNYIDGPQLRYFRDEVAPRVSSGDALILCVAKPSWVDANAREPNFNPDLYTTLDFFERRVIEPTGAHIRLALSGDRHHYARYGEVHGDRQLVTCGGGGAFLSDTHGLPDPIQVPHPASSDPGKTPSASFTLAAAYPDKSSSRAIASSRVWTLLWNNDSFPLFVGGIAFLLARMAKGAIEPGGQAYLDVPLAWISSAVPVVFLLVLAYGLVRFTKTRGPRSWALGGGHFLAHAAAIAGTIWVASEFVTITDGMWGPLLVAAVAGVAYAVIGSEIVAAYFLVADRFRVNRTELYSAIRIAGRKSFLRLRIDEAGCTLFPVKLENVPTRWRLAQTEDLTAPWFEAVDYPPAPELIEPPVLIRREPPP